MFLEIVEGFQSVAQSPAFGKTTPAVKMFDLIQNRDFSSVNSIQQKRLIRFEKGSDVETLPSGRDMGG